MIIVLDIDSIQRVIDPTWIRFLFFVNEQSMNRRIGDFVTHNSGFHH
jgi:hypothetical protein